MAVVNETPTRPLFSSATATRHSRALQTLGMCSAGITIVSAWSLRCLRRHQRYDNAALVDADESAASAEPLPIEANQLAPTHSACPTQRQQGRVAGSQALCWSRPSISAHKSSARLGLAHGFLPRLRIGNAPKHARDPRYFHCAGKLRGSVRQLAAPGISVPPCIMEARDRLLLCVHKTSAIPSSSCVCLCPNSPCNP